MRHNCCIKGFEITQLGLRNGTREIRKNLLVSKVRASTKNNPVMHVAMELARLLPFCPAIRRFFHLVLSGIRASGKQRIRILEKKKRKHMRAMKHGYRIKHPFLSIFRLVSLVAIRSNFCSCIMVEQGSENGLFPTNALHSLGQ
jgi:hypothetical protein